MLVMVMQVMCVHRSMAHLTVYKLIQLNQGARNEIHLKTIECDSLVYYSWV